MRAPVEPVLERSRTAVALLASRPELAGELDDPSAMPALIGGTAWVFSHENLHGCLDTLFVDEAGQVSLHAAERLEIGATVANKRGDSYQTRQGRFGRQNALIRGMIHLLVSDAVVETAGTLAGDPGTLDIVVKLSPPISGASFDRRVPARTSAPLKWPLPSL